MTPPDVRVPPLPAGTRCTLDGREVLAYLRQWSGYDPLSERYECWPAGMPRSEATPVTVTRDQLQVIGGAP